jgi:1-acylglycerone phosphate reductase
MYAMPILDVDLDVARQTYEVNTLGLVGTTQAFAPLVIAAKGRIMNIGSVASIMPVPWQGIYASSKAAMHHLSDNMRLELAPFDVKVILVRPLQAV